MLGSLSSVGARAWAVGGLIRSRRPAADRSGGAHAQRARQPKACPLRVPTCPSRAKSAAARPGPSAHAARVPTPHTAWRGEKAKRALAPRQKCSVRRVARSLLGSMRCMRVCLPSGRWALCERRRGGYEAWVRLGLAYPGFVGPTRLVARQGDASVGPACHWASTPASRTTERTTPPRSTARHGHL